MLDRTSFESLARIEAQVRADYPDSVYLAPVLSGPRRYCLNLARRATEGECVGLILRADATQIALCRTCANGQRLAATSPFKPRQHPVYADTYREELSMDAELVKLARELRRLTVDGRLRVLLPDLMHAADIRQYADALELLRKAGIPLGRPVGHKPAIVVDAHVRAFLSRVKEAA